MLLQKARSFAVPLLIAELGVWVGMFFAMHSLRFYMWRHWDSFGWNRDISYYYPLLATSLVVWTVMSLVFRLSRSRRAEPLFYETVDVLKGVVAVALALITVAFLLQLKYTGNF